MLPDDLSEISSFVEAPVCVHLHLPHHQVVGRLGLVGQGAGGEIEGSTVGLAVGHLLETASDISQSDIISTRQHRMQARKFQESICTQRAQGKLWDI